MVLSLLARVLDILGWDPCRYDVACGRRMDMVSMLGAAFPHVLGYPVEVWAGAWAIGFLLILDTGLAILLWRSLPERVGWPTVAALLAAWTGLSVLSVQWVAVRLVIWAVKWSGA